ncbi:MAG TPA: hypothetical protein VFT72_06875 [Opitutaceae bacterium]|nr:hypothetical protein [Opitutaceae bacterium]
MKPPFLWWAAAFLAITCCSKATLVTPPTIDWVSIPATASVGTTVNVGVGGHANPSDNSDGNDWNTAARLAIWAVYIDVEDPHGNWTRIYDFLPVHQTPVSVSASFAITMPGTYYVQVQLMDGRPWYSSVPPLYQVGVPVPSPTITSSLNIGTNEGQSYSYTIQATNSPTSFNATGLPNGFTVNTTNGVIAGAAVPLTPGGVIGGVYGVAISAANSYGSDAKTLTWTVAPANIVPAGSVSQTPIYTGQSVTLIRDGTASFGVNRTEGTIWYPNGGGLVLPAQPLGSMTYAPDQGPGTYSYQYRLIDNYNNYRDQWIDFTVLNPVVTSPGNFHASVVGSTFVTLTWSASTGNYSIDHYNIYRDGSLLQSVAGGVLTFTDTSVAPLSSHSYMIYAVDVQGNVSPTGNSVPTQAARALEVFSPL